MRSILLVLACVCAALVPPARATAGPAGVRHPLAPPFAGHALWDPDRHWFWVFEATAEGIWSWNPGSVTHWQWHGIGSFGAGVGQYNSGRNVFLDRARNRLVAPGPDRLHTLDIRTRMTWEFAPAQGPVTSFGAAVHDEANDRILALDEAGALSQLTLSGPPTWSPLAVTNTLPGLAGDQALGLDPEHGVLVAVGGTRWDAACNTFVPSNQAWALSLATLTWTPLPDFNVAGAYDLQLVWDAPRHRMLAVGGRYGFYCESSGQWYEGSSSQVHAVDPVAASPSWSLVTTRPGARTSGAIARNADADLLVNFGGFAPVSGMNPAHDFNDVQSMAFSGPGANIWTQDSPNSPDAADGPDFAFDPLRGHVFMHGGLRALSAFGDYATSGAVLAFDDPDTLWAGFTTAHDSREAAVAVLPAHDRVVWFGGRSKSPVPITPEHWLNTTTTVALGTGVATQPVTGTSPPARTGAVLGYDTTRDRVLLFGGRDESFTPLAGVWSLSPLTWTWSALATTGTAPVGDVHAACFDALTNRTFVLSNDGLGAHLHALLPSAGSETWAEVASTSPMPLLVSLALDTARHRLLGVDHELGVYEAAIGSGAGPLDWAAIQPPLAAGTISAVAMFDAAGDRLLLGMSSLPTSPGKAGLWAVEFGAGALGVPGGAPSPRAGLRLAGAQPSSRGPEVECALGAGETDARLELFDVLGRRVWSRALGPLGAGLHRVRAGEGLALAPGVYTVRLTRAGVPAASVRAVVVR